MVVFRFIIICSILALSFTREIDLNDYSSSFDENSTTDFTETDTDYYSSTDAVPQCPNGKRYSSCGANPSCQRTCFNYQEPIPCDFTCISGCICERGLVIGPSGQCISPRQCSTTNEIESVQNQFPVPIPKICNRDEVFSVCVSSCPDDCDNYKDPSRRCNRICLPGCACKKGTIRGPDGKCIKPEECPRDVRPEDCSQFEYYDACGTACPDDCSNYNIPDRQFDKRCVIGCFCHPGYVRGPNDTCIFPFDCPKQQRSTPCSDNQRIQHSIDETRNSKLEDEVNYLLNEIFPQNYFLESEESLNSKLEDEVKFLLNEIFPENPTLESEETSTISCPENEVFSQCNAYATCQKNCTNYNQVIPCPKICVSGCVCEEGFVRETFPNGRCISPDTCVSDLESWYENSQEESESEIIRSKPSRNSYQLFVEEINQEMPSDNAELTKYDSESFQKPTDLLYEEDVQMTCPENEIYSECNALDRCQRNCTNYDKVIPCPLVCVKGCVCQEGFVRSSFPRGRCIKHEFCPEDLSKYDTQQTESTYGCPDEGVCNRNCKRDGYGYGMCLGHSHQECTCF